MIKGPGDTDECKRVALMMIWDMKHNVKKVSSSGHANSTIS